MLGSWSGRDLLSDFICTFFNVCTMVYVWGYGKQPRLLGKTTPRAMAQLGIIPLKAYDDRLHIQSSGMSFNLQRIPSRERAANTTDTTTMGIFAACTTEGAHFHSHDGTFPTGEAQGHLKDSTHCHYKGDHMPT